MAELLKTILTLSLIGAALTLILLCLKPFTAKKFPAVWQYYSWVVVLVCMLVPIYKFVPEISVQYINLPAPSEPVDFEFVSDEVAIKDVGENFLPETAQKTTHHDYLPLLLRFLPYIWLLGALVFLLFAVFSYRAYIFRKRRSSFLIQNEIFDMVKKELGIKRKVSLCISSDITSPVLVGVFCPKVYIPDKEIDDDRLKMVFLHELTHCKRHDLVIKWLSLFVNAIHWFNPFAYVLSHNISDSCEVMCDVAVTKGMSEQEQKLYMKTILDFAIWRKENV